MHLVSAPRRVPLLTIVLLAAAFGSETRTNLIINPTFNDATIPNGVTATEFHSAVNYAIQEFESHFSDNIHINITFQFGNTGLGESSTHLTGYFTYA